MEDHKKNGSMDMNKSQTRAHNVVQQVYWIYLGKKTICQELPSKICMYHWELGYSSPIILMHKQLATKASTNILL